MDYLARDGWDVWLVDLRGYGRSTRPPEMDQPPGANPPLVTTDVAVQDVGSAVDFILGQRKAPRLLADGLVVGDDHHGSTLHQRCARRTRSSKLVLYAPPWLRTTRSHLRRARTM